MGEKKLSKQSSSKPTPEECAMVLDPADEQDCLDCEGDECDAFQVDVRRLGYKSGAGNWLFSAAQKSSENKRSRMSNKPAAEECAMVLDPADEQACLDCEGDECDAFQVDVRRLGYKSGAGNWLFGVATRAAKKARMTRKKKLIADR